MEFNAVDDGEDEDDAEIDAEVNEGADGRTDDDDVFGEVNFAQQVAAVDDAHHALAGGFGEKRPKDLGEEESDGEVWNAGAETEKVDEDSIHNRKHEEGS